MKQYLLLLVWAPLMARAQCPEDPATHIGGYKKNAATMYEVSAFGRKNLVQIRARLEGMAALLEQAIPQPIGCTFNWTPMPYEELGLCARQPSYYSHWFVQPFFCNERTHKLTVDETPLSPIFNINGIDDRILIRLIQKRQYGRGPEGDLPILINGRQLMELPPQASQRLPAGTLYHINNGCNRSGNQNTVIEDCGYNMVLITRPGKELFTPVSREQYLDYLVRLTQTELSNYQEPTYEQASHSYFPTRASFETDLKKNRDQREDKLKRLQALVNNMSVREKQLPAWVPDTYGRDRYQFSVDYLLILLEGKKPIFSFPGTGSRLVTVNEDYFDTSLPPYVPQLVSFCWQTDSSTPFIKYFNTELMAKLNFQAIAGLLGK